jgi:hypothetical protein
MKRYAVVLGAVLLATTGAHAQQGGENNDAQTVSVVPYRVEPVPFGPGEMMTYRAKWGIFGTIGNGSLMVEAIDTVRGSPAYRLNFRITGRVAVFSMADTLRSWLDVAGLYAHRFEKRQNGSYERDKLYDFYPEEMHWVRTDKPEENGDLASAQPLDDVSFLYFVRTLPLDVGATYTLPRYYKEDGNPVTIKVLRRERVKVPAGEFDAIVVQPIIKTDGMFSEDGEAEVWFTDDADRILVKLQAKMAKGTLKMEMETHTRGTRLVSADPSLPLRAGK